MTRGSRLGWLAQKSSHRSASMSLWINDKHIWIHHERQLTIYISWSHIALLCFLLLHIVHQGCDCVEAARPQIKHRWCRSNSLITNSSSWCWIQSKHCRNIIIIREVGSKVTWRPHCRIAALRMITLSVANLISFTSQTSQTMRHYASIRPCPKWGWDSAIHHSQECFFSNVSLTQSVCILTQVITYSILCLRLNQPKLCSWWLPLFLFILLSLSLILFLPLFHFVCFSVILLLCWRRWTRVLLWPYVFAATNSHLLSSALWFHCPWYLASTFQTFWIAQRLIPLRVESWLLNLWFPLTEQARRL